MIEQIDTPSFSIFVFAHSPTREPNTTQDLNLLWNRLTTLQDTHDQENNTLLLYQQWSTGDSIVCGQRNKQRNNDGCDPEQRSLIYSNDRNSYNFLGPCVCCPSELPRCSLPSPCLVPFNTVCSSSTFFVDTKKNRLVSLHSALRGYGSRRDRLRSTQCNLSTKLKSTNQWCKFSLTDR